jgi:DNA polymerase
MPWCVPDFETVSQCDLKKAGAYRYAEDPTTNILCLAVWFGEGDEVLWYPGEPCPPRLLDAINDPAMLFVAHNADFEKSIWRLHLVPLFGWPDVPNKRWHDTAARAANVNLPRGLDKVLTALDGPLEKDMEGNKLTIGLSRVNAKTGMMPAITRPILERVGEYCLGDVRGQAWIAKRLGWLDPGERTTYLLDQEINERGLMLDMPLVRKMQHIVDEASGPLAAEFKELTGGLKMTQVAKVHGWLLSKGVVLPDMTKDTLAAALGETDEGEYVELDDRLNVSLPQDVRRALRIRQLIGSSSIKKLGAMESCVSTVDGRARGLLLYHGAGPGRWTGRLLQPQNFPRGSLGEAGVDVDALVAALMTGDHEYVAACYGPAVETVVSSLRHTICAAPGNALVAGDYASIEARLVLAMAGQHDKTALMAAGADVYVDMALDIYEMRRFDVTDKALVKAFKVEHLEKRQVGKNTILGCGFQMGAPKFHDRYCPEQPLEFAEKVIKAYRNDWAPCVPKMWYGLQEAAIRAVWDGRAQEAYGVVYQLEDAWLTARLPSGRKLWYFSPKKTRRAMPWDEDDVRPGFSYLVWKNGQRRVVDAYGGLLTENVVQGTARDLLRDAMIKCRKENLPMVLTVHDELVLELAIAKADPSLLQEIMEDIPAWAKALQVPVESECWAATRYRK